MENGNASNLSSGQFAEFAAAAVRHLPRGISPKRAQQLIENPNLFAELLKEGLLVPKPEHFGPSFYPSINHSLSLEDMLLLGRYASCAEQINVANFPLTCTGTIIDSQCVYPAQFDRAMRFEDIRTSFEENNIRPATLRELLALGILLSKSDETGWELSCITIDCHYQDSGDHYFPWLNKQRDKASYLSLVRDYAGLQPSFEYKLPNYIKVLAVPL